MSRENLMGCNLSGRRDKIPHATQGSANIYQPGLCLCTPYLYSSGKEEEEFIYFYSTVTNKTFLSSNKMCVFFLCFVVDKVGMAKLVLIVPKLCFQS